MKVADLRKQTAPLGYIDTMFGEDVCALTVRDAVAKCHGTPFMVTMKEREVDTMLASEVPHGGVYSGTDDCASRLVVTVLLEWEFVASHKELEQVQSRDTLASKTVVSSYKLGFGA